MIVATNKLYKQKLYKCYLHILFMTIENKVEPIVEDGNVVLREYYANVHSKFDSRMATILGPFPTEQEARESAIKSCINEESPSFEHAIMKVINKIGGVKPLLALPGDPTLIKDLDTSLDYSLWLEEQVMPQNLRMRTKVFEFDLTGLDSNYTIGGAGGLVGLYRFRNGIDLYISNGGRLLKDTIAYNKFTEEDLVKRFNLKKERLLGNINFYYTAKADWHKKDPKQVRTHSRTIPKLVAQKVVDLVVKNMRDAGYEVRGTDDQHYHPKVNYEKWGKLGVKYNKREIGK